MSYPFTERKKSMKGHHLEGRNIAAMREVNVFYFAKEPLNMKEFICESIVERLKTHGKRVMFQTVTIIDYNTISFTSVLGIDGVIDLRKGAEDLKAVLNGKCEYFSEIELETLYILLHNL